MNKKPRPMDINPLENQSIYLIIILLLLTTQSFSQQMADLGFDNYNGMAGISINPAYLSNTKVYLDANLLTSDFFLENDLGYFNKDTTNFWDLIRIATQPGHGSQNISGDLYTNHNKKNFYSSIHLQGPSFMIQYGNMAFAVGIDFRSESSGFHLPYEIVQSKGHLSDTVLVHKSFDDRDFSISNLDWTDIHINYSYDLLTHSNAKLTAGAALKILLGLGGAFTKVSQLNYEVPNKKTLNINNLSGQVAIALPIDYNDNSPYPNPYFKGHGIGLDIGFLYTQLKRPADPQGSKPCEQPFPDYQFRLGISIMDIGVIKFTHHAEIHNFPNQKANWEHFDTVAPTTFHGTMETMSKVFFGNPNSSLADTNFSMSLPTVISVQSDYQLKKNYYLGFYWRQPLRFKLRTVRAAPLLAIIPRYETRNLGISLPVSLYNYQKPQIGLALRFYSVTIGTEKLGTFFGIGDFTGMDFYFSIRFNLSKGHCSTFNEDACSNKF